MRNLILTLLTGTPCVDFCTDVDANQRRANRQRLTRYEERLDAWLKQPRAWSGDPLDPDAEQVDLDPLKVEKDLVLRTEAGQQLRRRLCGLWARDPWGREPPPPDIAQAFADWLRSGPQPAPRAVLRLAHRG